MWVNNLHARYTTKEWKEYPPYEERARADNGCVLEADDITQTKYRSRGIDGENEFELSRQRLAPTHHAGSELLGPEAECGNRKIVQTSDSSGPNEGFGLVATAFARDEDLGSSRSLREGIFAVFLLYEILAERNEEKDTKATAEQG